jgi:predicted nucleotide-binding protein (sugar kinase/HSP70/actin superfamily)
MDLPQKLRNLYGVDVFPMDFLDTTGCPACEGEEDLYWDYGRKIVQAALFADASPDLQIIFMTNFKCGPDSFIRHDLENRVRDPFLVLQLDGHGNDAGMMTRCEAYLESKGFL